MEYDHRSGNAVARSADRRCRDFDRVFVFAVTARAEYQVSFKEMAQRDGWGEPRPKSITPNQLYTLTFAFEGSGQEFELFVDDIQFVECKK
jgi:hypothetical protein